jgi:dTDP-4-amino-4,6-dideoxygalactose transaminase
MVKIKLFDPHIGKKEKIVINSVLKSKFWASGSGGGEVYKFEKEFKKYIDCKSCVSVNSGTAALNLALSMYDIKDKEVILPSLTFVSTANACVLNKSKPIFVDINSEDCCIDTKKIEEKITKKTAAIIPVHFAGMPCKMNIINKIAKKHNLIVIEDAAHATGTTFMNKKIGGNSSTVCFSFHPVKNLAMPNGGMITLNNKAHKTFRKKLEAMRWCGITNRVEFEYDVKQVGNNYYMNEFSAAIGRVQLKKIDYMNKIRKKIAKTYDKELKIEKRIPFSKDCSYHIYWIMVKNRKKFMKKMKNVEIETGIHYKPVHTMTRYKNSIKLPVTERVGREIVSIPIHPNLSKDDVVKIIKYINKFAE